MTFGRNIQKDSRIEFACFSFHLGLLFINFSSIRIILSYTVSKSVHFFETQCTFYLHDVVHGAVY